MFSASKTAAPSGGYTIQRSVRLRSSASAYFNRTPASAGNRKTWTLSTWVKRGALTGTRRFIAGTNNTGGVAAFYFEFDTSERLNIGDYASPSWNWQLTTTQVFRDPSSWYHIVIAFDTTQATSTNRVKLYINGVQVTAFGTATYPSLNYDGYLNSATLTTIGDLNGASLYFDGYLTEINFIDGQALTPTSFGAYNSTTGVWQPIRYSGTYGTNGFYLNFADNSAATAAAIGKDSSGNGNNWTPNNISVTAGVTYDSMTDVPTLTSATAANFCTFNPLILRYSAGTTFSEANLKATGSSAYAWGTTNSGLTGKYYWEMTVTAGTSVAAVGVDDGIGQTSTPNANFVVYLSNGQKTINATSSAYGASYTTGDIIGVALNMDTGAITFYKNNTSQGAISNAFTAGVLPHVECGGSWAFQANFGQRPFNYTPPSGFIALNTYNLPTPTISNGAAYMAATTYTGNGGTQSITNTVNSVSFKPDMVWVKARSVAYNNYLTDSVRGAGKELSSNLTDAESSFNLVSAFNSNGFTVFTNGTYLASNQNGTTYVGWQWKESASSGLDIVSQTLATTGINTITHNLGVVPKMVIAKRTNGVEQWLVYQSSATTQSQYLGLNTTAAVAASANLWGSSAFTSSQIYFSGTSGNVYVFYIFAEIAGFSKFGSYTGNGSADGPFVYLGFRPRFILIKPSTETGNWFIRDTSRDTYNAAVNTLYPNLSDAEFASSASYDILSNGFKVRSSALGINTNGQTYIYAAFAENPFNYSLAR